MVRSSRCLLAVWALMGIQVSFAEEADLIKAGVKQACDQYEASLERISNELIGEFDRKIESNRRNAGQQPELVKQNERLQAAKDRFLSTGTLPPPEVLSKPAEDFERALKKAREALEADYDKAIAAGLRLKQDSLVSTLKSQKDRFERDFERQHPPRIVARWLHVVGRRDKYYFNFASDGRILSPAMAERSWEIRGNLLILKTKDAKAPGGYWVDRCKLSADGQSYTGRNQDNTEIQGTKLALD